MSEELITEALAETAEAPAPAAEDMTPIERTMSETFDRMNQPRTSNGQFAVKAQPTLPQTHVMPPRENAEALKEVPAQVAQKPQGEPVSPSAAVPQSLPAELRDEWGKASPKITEWIAKREAETHKKITELGRFAKEGEHIRAVSERYRPIMGQLKDAEAYEHLLAAQDYLTRDPEGGIKFIADSYGIDLGAIAARQGGLAETPRVDTAALESAMQSNVSLIEHFRQDKEDWADMEADIFEQICAIRASDPYLPAEAVLTTAYDRATKINQKVATKRRKAEAEKEAVERKRKADEAKRLASMNVKSVNGASPKPKGTWEDTMREVADRLMR